MHGVGWVLETLAVISIRVSSSGRFWQLYEQNAQQFAAAGGFISDFTMGGFIHVLLVVAVVWIVVRLIQGKKFRPVQTNNSFLK